MFRRKELAKKLLSIVEEKTNLKPTPLFLFEYFSTLSKIFTPNKLSI